MDGETFTWVDAAAGRTRAADEGTELVDELANVFTDEEDAHVLLCAAGFPRDRAPRFTTPRAYWTKVVEMIRNGVLSGLSPLIKAAAALFPHNETFMQHRDIISIKGDQGPASLCSHSEVYKITLKIEHVTMGGIGEFLTKLQQVTGDESISLEQIEKGSVVLTLRMSSETANLLSESINKGKLSCEVGYQISALHLRKEQKPDRIRALQAQIERVQAERVQAKRAQATNLRSIFSRSTVAILALEIGLTIVITLYASSLAPTVLFSLVLLLLFIAGFLMADFLAVPLLKTQKKLRKLKKLEQEITVSLKHAQRELTDAYNPSPALGPKPST